MSRPVASEGARDWAGLLFLAIGVTLIAHSLWVRVTTQIAPSLTSIIYYGQIPIAIIDYADHRWMFRIRNIDYF